MTLQGHLLDGNGKYSEDGLPAWLNKNGLPLLKADEKEAARITNNWNKYTPGQMQIYLERVLAPASNRAKSELIKDFGQEFVLGKSK